MIIDNILIHHIIERKQKNFIQMGTEQNRQQNVRSLVLGDDIEDIKTHFLLRDKDIFKLLEVFVESDTKAQGYLAMDDFINFVVQDSSTLILPSSIHLFRLIAKQQPDKLYFEEWLGSMISFCLYNKQSLFKFIFQMIDTDYDQKITYQNIIGYLNYEDPKNKIQVFPASFISSFQQSEIDKSKFIHFQQFRKMSQNLKFLCWPAQNLQQSLRKRLLGTIFWEQLSLKIEEKESQIKNMSNKDRLAEQNKKIKQQKFKKLFQSRVQVQSKFKKKMHLRIPGEVGSDTKLSFKICHEDNQFKQIRASNRRKSLFDR